MGNKYPIVTICGSMRFFEEMIDVANMLTAKGEIVLMPFVVKSERVNGAMLDAMHREKINMSDYIVVVTNEAMYIGDSTRGEIEYAKEIGHRVHIENVG